ncbi:MAG TPA: hypothetical protein VF579_03540 [Candidatus Methylomirabilis sp.]
MGDRCHLSSAKTSSALAEQTVTATVRVRSVFVVRAVGSRRRLHLTVTSHPTAAWTLQQCRDVLAAPHASRFVLHDRDPSYSRWLAAAVTALGVRVLRTPVQAPHATAYCARLLDNLRRKCLDFLIPLGEKYVRRILCAWETHSNRGRPSGSGVGRIPARLEPFSWLVS